MRSRPALFAALFVLASTVACASRPTRPPGPAPEYEDTTPAAPAPSVPQPVPGAATSDAGLAST